MRTMKAIAFTGKRRAELIDRPCDDSPLKPDEVAGRTLATLVSPGTEINSGFDADHTQKTFPGYASVFEIDALGEGVKDLKIGQRCFSLGTHASRQRHPRRDAFEVPEGVSPGDACHARLVGVSWATLSTTRARPPARVLIMGLGIVGNLGAQLFAASGYEVVGVDPVEARQKLARRVGITDVRPKCSVDDEAFAGSVMLAIDCSGHEQAVLDACKVAAKGGEVVLVGFAWRKKSDVSAYELLVPVFQKFLTLRSGWEWELPVHSPGVPAVTHEQNWKGALDWIAQGKIRLEGLTETARPEECQRVYERLMEREGESLSTVFDWQRISH